MAKLNITVSGELSSFNLTREEIINAAKFFAAEFKANTNPVFNAKIELNGFSVQSRELMAISNDDEYTDEDIADMLRATGTKLED